MDDSVTVTLCENGPLLIRGPYTLLTQEGTVIDPGRATVALCRCGLSSAKPFCDGSHKLSGFRAAGEPDAPSPVPGAPAPRAAGEPGAAA